MRALHYLAIGIAATIAIPCGLQAQAAALARPIQFHNPAWSPAGRQLLFESTLRGPSAIFAIAVDGSGLRQLTPDSIDAQQARWSPDDAHVVYAAGTRGRRDIYVMQPDGQSARRLTDGGSGERFFASYSSDGAWIAFQLTPTVGEVASRVYIMRADGSQLRRVSDTAYSAEAPMWLPDSRRLAFRRVAYPKRRWNEMEPAEARRALSAATWVSLGVDETTAPLRDATPPLDPVSAFADSAGAEGARASRDGRLVAYAKAVDGWPGLYVYDRSTRSERLLIGGAGAGPLGYLRVATLVSTLDTLDTFTSARESGAPLSRSGASYVRTVRRVAGGAWELTDSWRDSAGAITTTQLARTARGTLAIEREAVRSRLDSASLLTTGGRATGWVVPEGQPPRLFEYPAVPPLYARPMVVAAIAAARPVVGSVFVAPMHALYSTAGLTDAVDSILVIRRDSLPREGGHTAVLVLQHADGQQSWVDEGTGRIRVARGAAGPRRWWWHVVRGYSVTAVP